MSPSQRGRGARSGAASVGRRSARRREVRTHRPAGREHTAQSTARVGVVEGGRWGGGAGAGRIPGTEEHTDFADSDFRDSDR